MRARAIREDLQAGGRPGPYLYQAHLMADLERRIIDGHNLTRESLRILQSIDARLERLEARQQTIDTRLNYLRRTVRALQSLARRATDREGK